VGRWYGRGGLAEVIGARPNAVVWVPSLGYSGWRWQKKGRRGCSNEGEGKGRKVEPRLSLSPKRENGPIDSPRTGNSNEVST